MVRNKHTCQYCGVSVVNPKPYPPSWCDHCGTSNFTTTPKIFVDYYGEGESQQAIEFDDDPTDWSTD